MNYHESPRSHNRALIKIELPNEIKTFFSQRRKFIRGLPSYEQIEGVSPENHEQCFDMTYGYPRPLQETHPVNNQGETNYKKSQTNTRDLLHLFFHVSRGSLAEPLREYMLTGGTKPIRVTTQIEEDRKRVYVKLPSIERIMGLSFYNLISDKPPIDFLFSEYVFVEDSVIGSHIARDNIQYFKMLEKLPESLIRLSIQDRFLGINDLDRIVNLPGKKDYWVNLLIQSNGEAIAFDVDCAFTEISDYNLVKIARNNGIPIREDLEKTISKDEAKRIMHTIKSLKNKDYNKLIWLMDKTEYLRKQFSQIGLIQQEIILMKEKNGLKVK
jgi:hypothetical protein